jgi:hypothetical protein
MRRGLISAVIVLLPAVASAQGRLPDTPLPDLGSSSVPGTLHERDLFRVDPAFYRTPPDPRGSVVPPFVVLGAPFAYWYVPSQERVHSGRTSEARRKHAPYERDEPRRDEQPRTPESPPALPPIVPGVPKTLYVLPGCYAGDKPPQPEWLGPGCDMSRLRVIEP